MARVPDTTSTTPATWPGDDPIPAGSGEDPVPGPAGPRTPYPVNDPGLADLGRRPGSAPDVVPGVPDAPLPSL